MVQVGLLIFGAVIAFVAYRESENFKRQNGITPWRVPSWVWAIIGFVSLILCAVLLLFARRTTKPDPYMPAMAWSPAQAPVYASTNAWTAPGWHPDPSGRFQFRYWDGMAWTEHVSTQGKTKSDPL